MGVLLAWTGLALAQYTFTTIELPVPVADGASCTELNNAGDMVGSYVDGQSRDQGFLLTSDGQFTLLPLLNPHGLTDDHHFVGTFFQGIIHGFLHLGTEFLELNALIQGPDGPERVLQTEAIGLHQDMIVGDYRVGDLYHAFQYQHGQYTTIDPPFVAQTPYGCGAEGLNADGAIIGNCSPFAYLEFQR
jgi:hypothetical protein